MGGKWLGWYCVVCCALGWGLSNRPAESAEPIQPLPRAHAHNDYEHPRPLLDALAQGFCSVEADIHLADGELLVGHDPGDVRPDRTLKSLYLEPLSARVTQGGGWVYEPGKTVTLLIDIKTDGPATYRTLRRQLSAYRELFRADDGKSPPLRAIVSGNRPIAEITADEDRLVGIDGRLDEIQLSRSSSLMPLVSDNWRNHFRWRGVGPMPPEERAQLLKTVRDVHAGGYELRFWATRDDPVMWSELRAAGVDLIGTDDLTGLRQFLVK